MADRGLHINDRYRRKLSHRLEVAVLDVVVERFFRRERSDAERVRVGRQHGDGFANVLARDTVHRHTRPNLESVNPARRRDDERPAAETQHRGLERRLRPERGRKKQQSEHFAFERSRFGMLLEPFGQLE
jgi:hypothetical protein